MNLSNHQQSTDQAKWPEALATVTECKYDFRAGRALAFGMPASKHFRISYNYFAGDVLHTGQFFSATAIPQGHLFPIRYNPHAPHENAHDSNSEIGWRRSNILVIGIVGSILLSIAWLGMLHGCR